MFVALQNRFGPMVCQIIFLQQNRAVDIFFMHFIGLFLVSTMCQAGVASS
jgi:hypothetical protein